MSGQELLPEDDLAIDRDKRDKKYWLLKKAMDKSRSEVGEKVKETQNFMEKSYEKRLDNYNKVRKRIFGEDTGNMQGVEKIRKLRSKFKEKRAVYG